MIGSHRRLPGILALVLALAASVVNTGATVAAVPQPATEMARDAHSQGSSTWRHPQWTVPAMPEAAEIAATGAGDCTGWRNTILPPPTIRVYREAYGPLEGTVETVSLRTWTEQVLRTQMPAYYPTEALKANALTVKQYGWYYTINYRGGVAPDGNCYDVKDTGDGFYRPEVYTPAQQQLDAVAATWPYTVRKWVSSASGSRFFLTGYRAGKFVECGEEVDGYHLFQHSAFECGKDGMTWEGILRVFLEPKLEIVDPGTHNIVGNLYGDVGVMDGSVADTLQARTYKSTVRAFEMAAPPVVSIDAAKLRRFASGDLTGDRYDDLVALVDSDAGPRLRVWRSNGTTYDGARSWWTDTTGITTEATRLLVDDFDGDGRADAGLLVGEETGAGAEAAAARFYVLTSSGTAFRAPALWWSGTLDLAALGVNAGDADGDGRADLILYRDKGTSMEFLVMRSRLKGGALADPVRWLAVGGIQKATVKAVVGDFNRDGRDDLYLVYPEGAGTTAAVLRSTTTDTLTRRILWTSPSTRPIAFTSVKIASGDYNVDGRGDLLLLVDRASAGSRMLVLLPNDTTVTASKWLDDPTLPWATARPY